MTPPSVSASTTATAVVSCAFTATAALTGGEGEGGDGLGGGGDSFEAFVWPAVLKESLLVTSSGESGQEGGVIEVRLRTKL